MASRKRKKFAWNPNSNGAVLYMGYPFRDKSREPGSSPKVLQRLMFVEKEDGTEPDCRYNIPAEDGMSVIEHRYYGVDYLRDIFDGLSLSDEERAALPPHCE